MAEQDSNSGLMLQPVLFITTLDTVLGLLSLLLSSPLPFFCPLAIISPLKSVLALGALGFLPEWYFLEAQSSAPTSFWNSKCTPTFIAS